MIIAPLDDLNLNHPILDPLLNTAPRYLKLMLPPRRPGESSTEPGTDSLRSTLQQVEQQFVELRTAMLNYENAVQSYAELPYVVRDDKAESRINDVKVAREDFREAVAATEQGLETLQASLVALNLPETLIPTGAPWIDTARAELRTIQRKERERSVDLDDLDSLYATQWHARQVAEYKRLEELHEQRLKQQAASSPQQGPQRRANHTPAAGPMAADTPSITTSLATQLDFVMPPAQGAGPQAPSPQCNPNSTTRVGTRLPQTVKLVRKRALGRGRGDRKGP
jgi:hypothetical protein